MIEDDVDGDNHEESVRIGAVTKLPRSGQYAFGAHNAWAIEPQAKTGQSGQKDEVDADVGDQHAFYDVDGDELIPISCDDEEICDDENGAFVLLNESNEERDVNSVDQCKQCEESESHIADQQKKKVSSILSTSTKIMCALLLNFSISTAMRTTLHFLVMKLCRAARRMIRSALKLTHNLFLLR